MIVDELGTSLQGGNVLASSAVEQNQPYEEEHTLPEDDDKVLGFHVPPQGRMVLRREQLLVVHW